MSDEFGLDAFTPELATQAEKDIDSGMAAVTQSLDAPESKVYGVTSPEIAAWADKTYVDGVDNGKVLPAHAETWRVILPHAQEITGLGNAEYEGYKRFAEAADTDNEDLYRATEAQFGKDQQKFNSRIAEFDNTPSAATINMMAPLLKSLPALKGLIEGSVAGQVAGGATGLAVGLAESAVVPPVVFAIPADTLAGIGIGGVAGAFEASATMHRGRMYAELRREGVSHEDAKSASRVASLGLGAIDATALRYVLGSGKAIQEASQAGESIIRAAFTQYLKNIGVNVGSAAYQSYIEQATKATVGMMTNNGKVMPTPQQILERLPQDLGVAAATAAVPGALPLVKSLMHAGLNRGGKSAAQNMLDTMDDIAAQKPLPDEPTSAPASSSGAAPLQGTVTQNVTLGELEQARFDAARMKDIVDYEVESLPEGVAIPPELAARRTAANKELSDAKKALSDAQAADALAKAQAAFTDQGTNTMREALTGESIMNVVDSVTPDMPLVQKHMLANKAAKEIVRRFAQDAKNWKANRKLLVGLVNKTVPKELRGEFLNDIAGVDSADSVAALMKKGFAKKVERLIEQAAKADAIKYMEDVLDKTKAANVSKRDKAKVAGETEVQGATVDAQPVLSAYEKFIRSPELAHDLLDQPGAPDAVYDTPGGPLPRPVAEAIAGEVVHWEDLTPQQITELADKINDIRKAGVAAKHQELAERQAKLKEKTDVVLDGIEGERNKKGERKRPVTPERTIETNFDDGKLHLKGLINWWEDAWNNFGVWNGTWEFQVRTMLQHSKYGHEAHKLLDITEAETYAADANNKFVNEWKDETYRYEDGRVDKKGEVIRDPAIGDAIVAGTKRRPRGDFTDAKGKKAQAVMSDMELVQAHLYMNDRSLWASLHHGNKFTWTKKTLQGRVAQVAHEVQQLESAIDLRKLRGLKHKDLDARVDTLGRESAAYKAQLALHEKNPDMVTTESIIAKRFEEVPALQRIADGSARFYKKFYKFLNEHHIKEFGYPLAENPNYGGQALPLGAGTQLEVNMGDMLNAHIYSNRSIAPGFTKSRVTNTTPLRMVSVVANTKSHIGRGVHWKAFSQIAREFENHFNDPRVAEALESKFRGLSPEKATLLSHVRRAYKDFTGLERPNHLPMDMVEGVTRNLGTLGPGGNPFMQFLKQATGWAGYFSHIGVDDIALGLKDAAMHPKIVQERMRNSAFWRSRSNNAFFEFASVDDTTDIQSFREGITLNAWLDPDWHAYNLKQGLTAGTRGSDLLNIAMGTWNGAYLKEFKRNGGDAAAASLWADKVSNETQSSALPSAKSNFGRAGAIPQGIEQFSTQSRQTFGKFVSSVKEFGANPSLESGHRVVASGIASSLTQGMFTWVSATSAILTMQAYAAFTGSKEAKRKVENMKHDRDVATMQGFTMGGAAQGNPYGAALNAAATDATNYLTNSKNHTFMPSASTLEGMNSLTALGRKTAEMAISPTKPELKDTFEWVNLYLRSVALHPGTPSFALGKGVPADDLTRTLQVLSTKRKDLTDTKKRKGNFEKPYWMKGNKK